MSAQTLASFEVQISEMRLGDLTDLLITLRLAGAPEGVKAALIWERKVGMVRERLNALGDAVEAREGSTKGEGHDTASPKPRVAKVRNLGAFRGLGGR